MGRTQEKDNKALRELTFAIFGIRLLMTRIFAFLTIPLLLHAQVISDIEAESRFTDPVLIISNSGLNKGDSLNPISIKDAIHRLYRLGLFSQVSIDTSTVSGSLRVMIKVKEFPFLKKVEFIGNRRIKEKTLRDKIKAKEGDILTGERVFAWRDSIQNLYKEKGYILANISTKISPPDSANRSILKFLIEEGLRVRIKNIEIVGNKAFTDREIEGRLKNREKRWYRSGLFKEEEFKEDLRRIIDFYKERGYIDAKVEDYDIRYKEGWAYITIKVDEGKRYYLGGISFKGNKAIDSERLRDTLRIKPKDVYNAKKVQESLQNLYALYTDEGYIYVQILPQEDASKDTIYLTYEIKEGEPAHIRRVIIEGNVRTYENVIRRNIWSMPGTIFRRSEVIRSQREIFNLGFFEDIKVDYKKVNKKGDIDLIYRVKEKEAIGNVGAGVTYSAQEGIAGFLELSHPNLLGRGDNISIHLEKGGKRNTFEFGFLEPWFLETSNSLGFNLFYRTRFLDYYDLEEHGGKVNLARPLLLDFTRGYLTLKAEDVSVSDISPLYKPSSGYDLREERWPKRTLSVGCQFIRDSRDYRYNPSSGSYNSYSIEVAGGRLLGGDVEFIKQITDSRFYYPLFWKFSLMFRAYFGLIDNYITSSEIPVYERFYPGGAGVNGIRGYRERSVGPRIGEYNQGGKAVAIFNLDLKLKVSPQLAFLAFLDIGNAWDSIREVNFSDMKRGVGVGIRIEIPLMGYLGFDLGYGLDEGGRRFQPYFLRVTPSTDF